MDRLLRAVTWPQRALVSLPVWLATRPRELLLQSSPAIVVVLLLAAVILFEWSGLDSAAQKRYQQLANKALDANDRAASELYTRKLVIVNGEDPETVYALARLADLQGYQEKAAQLMAGLAPVDGAGHPRAHFWVAIHFMQQNPNLTGEQINEVMHHLQEALKSQQDRNSAHILLAAIERSRGRRERAMKHLEAVVLERPDMRLQLSTLYAETGDTFHASQERQRAVDYLVKKVDANAADVDSRVLLARAVSMGDEFSRGEQILLAGLNESPDEPRLKLALLNLYADWFDKLDKEQNQDPKQRLELLQKALARDPQDRLALERLLTLVDQTGEIGSTARSLLTDALAKGSFPATVHLILGTSAATQGNWDEAKKHLEQAQGQMPNAPVLLNNLAVVLSSADPPELDRALQLADAAAKMWPEHPEIRETRGTILARLKRWKEALVDLEKALQAFPNRPVLHERLADVYEGLGDSELGARHREQAKQKKAEPKTDTSNPEAKPESNPKVDKKA